MHTIDLLRGAGIPAKTTPGSISIVVLIVVVPFLVSMGMLDWYLRNKTTISIQQQAIAKERATISQFADAVEWKESLEKKKDIIHGKLSEVSSCVGNYIQWSPVLVTLVENMPDKMVMSELWTEHRRIRTRVLTDNDPNRPANITVSKRTLILDISGNLPGNYDAIVRNYRDRLRSSAFLGPKLENINVSQKPGAFGDDKTVSYTMNLTFESES